MDHGTVERGRRDREHRSSDQDVAVLWTREILGQHQLVATQGKRTIHPDIPFQRLMIKKNIISSYTGFQPLKEIWLGDCYPSQFYYHLPDAIKEPFIKITEWTKQDLNKIQKKLEELGVIVQRPKFEKIENYLNDKEVLLKPPIAPRDNSLTLGNEFYHLRSFYKKDPWQAQIDRFISNNEKNFFGNEGGLACLSPPAIVRVGRDIIMDWNAHKDWWHLTAPIAAEWAKKYRVHIYTGNYGGGHSDGVFCPVCPGLILSTHYHKDYTKTFPDWEVFFTNKVQNNFNGRWWTEDKIINQNKSFNLYILKHAKDWIGNFSETVFEVNMLVIDEKNILAIKHDDRVFDFLTSKGINVHVCDFRSRSFWDGGLHCLTLDIRREGNQIDYFPNRPNLNYMDWID